MGFEDYLADLISGAVAQADNSDFVMRSEDGQLLYVDIEDQAIWVISVQRGTVQVHG